MLVFFRYGHNCCIKYLLQITIIFWIDVWLIEYRRNRYLILVVTTFQDGPELDTKPTMDCFKVRIFSFKNHYNVIHPLLNKGETESTWKISHNNILFNKGTVNCLYISTQWEENIFIPYNETSLFSSFVIALVGLFYAAEPTCWKLNTMQVSSNSIDRFSSRFIDTMASCFHFNSSRMTQ